MKIKSITINGLKSLKDFNTLLWQYQIISWKNWTGKSTIKQSVLFCLYWKMDNISINDWVINNECTSATVTLIIEYDNKTYTITRVKNSDNNKLKINGTVVSDSRIEELFWSYDQFLVSYDVWAFSKLETDQKRSLVARTFPCTKTRLELYREIKKNPEAISLYDLEDIEISAKQCKKDIKEASNESLKATQSIQNFSAIISEEEKILSLNSVWDNIEAVKDEKRKLEDKLVSLQKIPQIQQQINDVKYRKNIHLANQPNEDKVNDLRKEAQWVLNTINIYDSKESICNTCKQAVNDERKTQIIKELEDKLQWIKNQWTKLADKYLTDTEAWKDKSEQLTIELAILQELYDAEPVTYKDEGQNIKSDIDKYNDMINNFLNQERRHSEASIKISTYKTLIEVEKAKFKKYDIVTLETEYDILNKYIILEETKLVTEKLKEYLWKGVEIILLRPNKTNDNFKYVFDIEKNEVSYQWLSTWEKMLIDISLAKLFSNAFWINVLAIDNTEQLTQVVDSDSRFQYLIFEAKKLDDNNLIINITNPLW